MRPLDAKQVLRQLLGAFPHAKLDEDAAQMYARALFAFPLDVAELAVLDVIQHDDRFPSLPRLVQAIRSQERRMDTYAPPEGEAEVAAVTIGKDAWRARGKAGVEAARAAHRKAVAGRRFPVSLDDPGPDHAPVAQAG